METEEQVMKMKKKIVIVDDNDDDHDNDHDPLRCRECSWSDEKYILPCL
jgi:hypothetical protein